MHGFEATMARSVLWREGEKERERALPRLSEMVPRRCIRCCVGVSVGVVSFALYYTFDNIYVSLLSDPLHS